jgi:hypothetical protein
MGAVTTLAEQFEAAALGCEAFGSPFYAALLRALAPHADADADMAALLAPYRSASWEDVIGIRFLGGVHRLVLTGRAPAVARHYPSVGGDGDALACAPAVVALVPEHRDTLADVLTRPPQTNEVGRSAALAAGFCWIAKRTSAEIATLELGSSAGLNSRWDQFRYEQGETAFGPEGSPVRFAELWSAPPPFGTPVRVVARRGCDRDPIDATTEDGRLTLLSYVWPDQRDRFERLRAACQIAARVPVRVDAAPIADWLPARLDERPDDATTVVFHSIVWQYLDAPTRDVVRAALATAGERGPAPLAWLRLEPDDETYDVKLRATIWPEGEEHVLARTEPHLAPIEWLAGS